MSIARKIMLLVVMALAAMAMAATSASAQSEVEVVNEDTGALCNPCAVHIEGEAHITALPAGVEVSKCHDEFNLRIYHNGSGEIEWTGTNHSVPGPGCVTVNCTGTIPTNEKHWPVTLTETGSGEQGTVRFCLRTTADLHCNATVPISNLGEHLYRFSVNVLCAGGARRVEGAWTTESVAPAQDIEIIHHS